jgi:signal transduction histidine kinase
MESEPIFSIPIYVVAIASFVLILLIIFLAVLITRKKVRKQITKIPDLFSPILEFLPWATAITTNKGRIIANNRSFAQKMDLLQGNRLSGTLVEAVKRVAIAGTPEVANLTISKGDTFQRVEISPLIAGDKNIGVMLLLSETNQISEDEVRYREIMGAISHELRTPLTAIVGHIDILESCGPEEEDLRKRSQRFIASEAARLASLVDELSRLTRLEGRAMNMLPVNPRSVAEESVSAVYSKAEAKEVDILLQAPPNLPRVSADPDALQQVLINLLDNAIKYTPSSESVMVTLKTNENGVEFAVSDNGPGIPKYDQPHLFDPFFRGSRTDIQAATGVGLGLTIVKSILDKHGSKIVVESDPGKGARFSFSLKPASSSLLQDH